MSANTSQVDHELLATAEQTIDTLRSELVEAQFQLHQQQQQSTEPPLRTEVSSLRIKLQHAEADAKTWKQQHDRVERESRQLVVECDNAKQRLKEYTVRAAAMDTERLKDIEKLTQRVAELETTVQIEKAKATMMTGRPSDETTATSSSAGSTIAEEETTLKQAGSFSFGAGGSRNNNNLSSTSFRPGGSNNNGAGTTSTQQIFLLQTENDSLKLRSKTLDTKVDQLNRAMQQANAQIREQQDQIRHFQYRQHDNSNSSSIPISATPTKQTGGSSPSSSITTATRFDLQEHEKLRADLRTAQQELRRVKGLHEELQRVHHLSTSNNVSLRSRCERFMSDNASLEQQLMQSRHSRDLLKMHVDAIMKNSSSSSPATTLDRDTSALQIAKEFDTAFYIMTLEHFAGVARLEQEQMRLMNSLTMDRAHVLEHQLAVGAAERLKLEREMREMRREVTVLRGGEMASASQSENVSPVKKQQPSPSTNNNGSSSSSIGPLLRDGDGSPPVEGWEPLPLLIAHEQIRENLEAQLRQLQDEKTRSDMHAEATSRTANGRVRDMLDVGRFHLLELSRRIKAEMLEAATHAVHSAGRLGRAEETQRQLDEEEGRGRRLAEEVEALKASVLEREQRVLDARRVSDEVSRAAVAGTAEVLQALHGSLSGGVKTLAEYLASSLYPFFSEEGARALLSTLKESSLRVGGAVVQFAALDMSTQQGAADVAPVFAALQAAVAHDVAFVSEKWKEAAAGLADAIARADMEHSEVLERSNVQQQRLAALVQAAQKHTAGGGGGGGGGVSLPGAGWNESPHLSPRGGSRGSSPSSSSYSMFASRRNAAPPAQAPATPPRQQQQHQVDDSSPAVVAVVDGSASSSSQLLRNAAGGARGGVSGAAAAASAGGSSSTGGAGGGISLRQLNQISQVTLVSFSSSVLMQKRDLGKHFMELLEAAVSSTTRIKRDSTYALDIVPVRRERDAALSELASANRAAFDLIDSRAEFEKRLKELSASLDQERQLKENERDKIKDLEMEIFAHKERALRMEGEATDLRFALHQRAKENSNQESAVVATLSEQQRNLMQRAQDLERDKMNLELSLADRTGEIRGAKKRATEAEHERDVLVEELRQREIELDMRAEQIMRLRKEGEGSASVAEALKMHLQQEQLKLEQATRSVDEWRTTAEALQRRQEVDENLLQQVMGGGSSWLSQQRSGGGGGGINDSSGAFGSSFFNNNNSQTLSPSGGEGEQRDLPPVELAAVKNAQRAMIDTTLERSRLEARIEAAKKEGVNSVAELRRAWDIKNNKLDSRELQLQEQNERLDAFCEAVLERMNMATNSERHHRLRCDTLLNVTLELRKMGGMFVRKIKRQAEHLRGWESLQMSRCDPVEFPRNDASTQTVAKDTVSFTDLLGKGKRKKGNANGGDSAADDAQGGGSLRHAQGGRGFLTLVIEACTQLHETHIVAGFPASALVLAAVMSLFSLISGMIWASSKCV